MAEGAVREAALLAGGGVERRHPGVVVGRRAARRAGAEIGHGHGEDAVRLEHDVAVGGVRQRRQRFVAGRAARTRAHRQLVQSRARLALQFFANALESLADFHHAGCRFRPSTVAAAAAAAVVVVVVIDNVAGRRCGNRG